MRESECAVCRVCGKCAWAAPWRNSVGIFVARPGGFVPCGARAGALPLHPTAFVKAGETFAALRAEGGQREQAMSKKVRLDVLLVDRALAESRQKAQATIMCGLVFVNGQRVDKPGAAVAEDAAVEVRGQALRYVSRGGLKLEKAMAI